MRIFFCIYLMLLTQACTPLDLLNHLVSKEGYRVEKNVFYGRESHQKLDLYLPETVTKDTPVVVFFYGGRWQGGRKEDYLFAAQGLVSLGYAVAVPDYRLYPQVKYPAFLEDSARAVAWVYRHIGEYGASGENLYLVGHSAGAYNAVMVALKPTYLKKAGGTTAWVRGVIRDVGRDTMSLKERRVSRRTEKL